MFAILEVGTTAVLVPSWLFGGWIADQVGARGLMVGAPLVHISLGVALWLTVGLFSCKRELALRPGTASGDVSRPETARRR